MNTDSTLLQSPSLFLQRGTTQDDIKIGGNPLKYAVSHRVAQDDIKVGGSNFKYMAVHQIVVIGGGYSGTISAANSLKASSQYGVPTKVTIYEREAAAQRCGGLAYGRDSALKGHYLNIQPHRLTIDRQHPEDCVEYLSKLRSCSVECVNKQNDISRHEYQKYISHYLNKALVHAPPGSVIDWKQEQVVNLKPDEGRVLIKTSNREKESGYHSAIVATGIQLTKKPLGFIKSTSERYIHSIYNPQSYEQIKSLSETRQPHGDAVVIGTGLSAFDAVIALRFQGFKGKIYCISRECNIHYRYDKEHSHKVGKAKRPDFLDLVNKETKASEIEEWVIEYIKRELRDRTLLAPDVNQGVHLENLMKGAEPFVSELVAKLNPETSKYLLQTHKSAIGTHRVGVIPKVYDFVQGQQDSGQCEFLKDNFVRVECDSDGVTYELESFGGTSKKCAVLINATGDNQTYKPELVQELWVNLLKNKYASSHFLGGVKVDSFGRMISENGETVDNVYLSGPMTSGDAIERRGRLGAFLINTGELRDRSEVSGKNAVSKKLGELLEIAQNVPDSSGAYQRAKQRVIKL
ncbi:FAD/NAD(P)-binding protein [Endozoicomonas elysicola]|uniref:FAD-dependent urate hydroxylase HpyO/Asp monooxygenase CreE-like FAD/NAD(P)-binding domain-containing protein n=1 Tax=Endozoicomonas elysicola TaxID=305900 RepID=A0A081K8S4_9GAMM|nr:FAD/NAD(P)-binding protein [Endozoicomonas elysicola]KEI70550.1 hypothetical protein GV64_07190 [Endozoicomonas elysicola]